MNKTCTEFPETRVQNFLKHAQCENSLESSISQPWADISKDCVMLRLRDVQNKKCGCQKKLTAAPD